MKKLVPNQLINNAANPQLSGKSLNLMMKSVLILMFTLFAANISAQDRGRTSSIMEVETFLASLRGSDAGSRSAIPVAAHVESLINDLQPAVYFSARGTNTYGENPNSLYTDPASLSNIQQATFAKANIEIVTIRLNSLADTSSIIDLSVFSDFPKLKYIYILSSVKTTHEAVVRSVKNAGANYSVFYKIAIGS